MWPLSPRDRSIRNAHDGEGRNQKNDAQISKQSISLKTLVNKRLYGGYRARRPQTRDCLDSLVDLLNIPGMKPGTMAKVTLVVEDRTSAK
jgi:hypothetical protein